MTANAMPTTAIPHRFDLRLTISAPFNTAASEPSRLGIDSPLLRDHRNRICLPGSLVQGRVFEELGNWDGFPELRKRLGNSASSGDLAPNRKGLIFGDLVMVAPERAQTTTFVRIGINDDTGSVQRGALQVIEQPAEPGADLTFTGYVLAMCNNTDAKKLVTELCGALRLVPNFGADRSVGFGTVQSVDVTLQPLMPEDLKWPGDATCIELAIKLDRPFLVTESSPGGNLFIGSEIIPGNALKGAFADTCSALGLTLPTEFNDIVFRHGVCALGEHRPRALPESLAMFKRGKDDEIALDLASCVGAVVLGSAETLAAPSFAIDWKSRPAPPDSASAQSDEHQLRKHFGWATPNRELRVRTAIESATRAAAEKQLFAYEQVIHEQNHGTSDTPDWKPLTWRTRIDISALADNVQQAAHKQILDVLRHGLVGLGKTKAHVAIAKIEEHIPPGLTFPAASTVYMTLQTPALMTQPGTLTEGADSQALHDAYAATIHNMSGGSIKLSHFYARQSVRGGYYQQQRFNRQDTHYEPWLMTNAGSVFALTVVDADVAAKKLDAWLRRGLPIPESWHKKYADWRSNPYLPQNGFGEIAINYLEHDKWSPLAQKIKVTPV